MTRGLLCCWFFFFFLICSATTVCEARPAALFQLMTLTQSQQLGIDTTLDVTVQTSLRLLRAAIGNFEAAVSGSRDVQVLVWPPRYVIEADPSPGFASNASAPCVVDGNKTRDWVTPESPLSFEGTFAVDSLSVTFRSKCTEYPATLSRRSIAIGQYSDTPCYPFVMTNSPGGRLSLRDLVIESAVDCQRTLGSAGGLFGGVAITPGSGAVFSAVNVSFARYSAAVYAGFLTGIEASPYVGDAQAPPAPINVTLEDCSFDDGGTGPAVLVEGAPVALSLGATRSPGRSLVMIRASPPCPWSTTVTPTRGIDPGSWILMNGTIQGETPQGTEACPPTAPAACPKCASGSGDVVAVIVGALVVLFGFIAFVEYVRHGMSDSREDELQRHGAAVMKQRQDHQQQQHTHTDATHRHESMMAGVFNSLYASVARRKSDKKTL